MSKEINTPQNNSEELDLGQLFKIIGRAIERAFRFIGDIVNKLFLTFVWLIFFTKKHIIKLVLASILGFAFGIFKEKTSEPNFTSSIIIKQNYVFGESLYNTINYYQDLVAEEDFTTLAEELSIDSVFVMAISSIEIEPLVSDNDRLLEFNNYTRKLDSTLASEVEYGDFLDSVKDHIYETQLLSINSKSNKNFNEVFNAIIKTLNENSYLKREREKDIRQLDNREQAINKALAQSDSLQEMYKKILEYETQLKNEKTSQTSITIEGSENQLKTREFDLFKNDIELRRDLVAIQREKEDKEYVLEVLSSTPKKGFVDSSIEIFGNNINPKLFFSVLFSFILFSVLLALRLFKYLEKYNVEIE